MNTINPLITTHRILRTRDRAVDRNQKSTKVKKRRKKHPVLEFHLHATSCHYTTPPVQTLLLLLFSIIIKQGAQDMQRKRRTVLKLLRRRSDLYLSYIMFTCAALIGKELASSGGWNQAYCSAKSARIGVLLLLSGLDVCLLPSIFTFVEDTKGL